MRYSRHKAFTLIELLVVIAVIAVLMVLVLPALQRSTSWAQQARCAGNLRAIHGGIMAYVADNGGTYIPASQGYYGYWYNVLAPYMGQGGVRKNIGSWNEFPGMEIIEMNHMDEALPGWLICPAKEKGSGYGWNWVGFGQNTWNRTTTAWSRVEDVVEPGKTIIVADSSDDITFETAYNMQTNAVNIPQRHSGGGNYLFADGHVENLTPAHLRRILPRAQEKYPGERAANADK